MKKAEREKLKTGNVVCITWVDISDDSDEGWVKPDKIKNKPAEIFTVGYVVKCSRDYVTLAMAWGWDYANEFEVGTTSAIPTGVIRNIDVLKHAA